MKGQKCVQQWAVSLYRVLVVRVHAHYFKYQPNGALKQLLYIYCCCS